MNKKQNEIMQFLLKINCCKEEALIEFLDCTKEDIAYLLNNKLLVKNNDIIYSKLRERNLDLRYCIVAEILVKYKNYIEQYKKEKYPVLFSFIAFGEKCDIIIAKSIEQDIILSGLDETSDADKIIIVLENPIYNKDIIKTKKECLICKYPLEIIDSIN